ncbi:Uncharacterized protein FKW44_005500, partial [Caligus rogercresseyi]
IDMSEIRNLVLDLGTSSSKIGWSSGSEPSLILPSGAMLNLGLRDTYVGRQAQNLRGILNLACPLSEGGIRNWEDLSLLWASSEVEADSSPGANVLLSVPPLCGKEDWKGLAEMLLEGEAAHGIYLSHKSALAMVCVDSGEDTTYVVPCLEGVPIPGATRVLRLGGKHVTEKLLKELSNGKYSFTDDTFLLWKRSTSSNKNARLSVASRYDVVKEAKERYCRVATRSLKEEGDNIEEKVLRLLTETLWLWVGIPLCARNPLRLPFFLLYHPREPPKPCTQKPSRRRGRTTPESAPLQHISGGREFLLPGMDARLQKELSVLFPSCTSNVKVTAQKGREFFSWEGGAHLASLDAFQELWISRQTSLKKDPTYYKPHSISTEGRNPLT